LPGPANPGSKGHGRGLTPAMAVRDTAGGRPACRRPGPLPTWPTWLQRTTRG